MPDLDRPKPTELRDSEPKISSLLANRVCAVPHPPSSADTDSVSPLASGVGRKELRLACRRIEGSSPAFHGSRLAAGCW